MTERLTYEFHPRLTTALPPKGADHLLELQLDLGQQLFDFGLGLRRKGRARGDDAYGLEEGKVFEQRETFVGEIDPTEFQMLQLRDAGDEFQIGIRERFGIGDRQSAQGGNAFDKSDAFGRVESVAELQIRQRKLCEVLKAARLRVVGADLQPFEFGELFQMNGTGICELGVGEADSFEIGQMFAELAETFIVNRAAAMTDFDESRPPFELCIGVAFHAGADEGK